jgi:CheY-like chemotaxis protein
MHALIIEDQPLIGMLIEDQLRGLGYTSFDVAADEATAIELGSARCPDLITADDRLTQGSGIDAVRTICAHQAIPVVFIVGNPHEVGIPDAVTLPKPFRAEDLRSAVEQAAATARTYA